MLSEEICYKICKDEKKNMRLLNKKIRHSKWDVIPNPNCSKNHIYIFREIESSLMASWLGFQAFTAVAQVQSLVREVPTSRTV